MPAWKEDGLQRLPKYKFWYGIKGIVDKKLLKGLEGLK